MILTLSRLYLAVCCGFKRGFIGCNRLFKGVHGGSGEVVWRLEQRALLPAVGWPAAASGTPLQECAIAAFPPGFLLPCAGFRHAVRFPVDSSLNCV